MEQATKILCSRKQSTQEVPPTQHTPRIHSFQPLREAKHYIPKITGDQSIFYIMVTKLFFFPFNSLFEHQIVKTIAWASHWILYFLKVQKRVTSISLNKAKLRQNRITSITVRYQQKGILTHQTLFDI